MKNILGTAEDLDLFNKEGNKIYSFWTSSTGCSREYTFDSNGRILTHRASDGYSYEFTYDSNGKVLAFKDSNGEDRQYIYDSTGKFLYIREF